MKKSITFLLLIILCSCNNSKKPNNIDELFNKKNEIEHTLVEIANDEILSDVYDLVLANDTLIVYDHDRDYFFSAIDLNNNKLIARFGKIGQGPNELLLMPQNITILNDSIMTIFSPNQNSLYTINLKNDFIVTKDIGFDKDRLIYRLLPISAQRYISLGGFEKGRYLLLDENGEELSYNFDYPSPKNGENLSTPMFKYMAFQGNIRSKPEGSYLYFAGRSSEIFEIVKVDNNDKLKKVFEFNGEHAQFVPEGDGVNTTAVAIRKESKFFFINSACTDKYIYLLYSKKIIGDNIYSSIRSNKVLVFDWNGKPITTLILDKEVGYIAVDNENKFMMAYDKDNDQLLKFQLDNTL